MTEIQKPYSPLLSDNSKQFIIKVNDPQRRKIIAAANKLGDSGVLLVGARHWDLVMHRQFEAMKDSLGLSSHATCIKQGFIDQYGQFVDRKEALEIAHKNNQELIGKDWPELYSENLY